MEAIAHPIPPIRTNNARCQEVVITGDDLRKPDGGLKLLPVPISTPGFDSAPYLTATFCVTKDPDSGIQNGGTYRAALKATDRAVVRMVARAGGAGGYLHWDKYNKRKEPMPIAIVIGAAPVVMFTGAQKLEVDLDELGVAGGLAGRPMPMVKCVTIDLDVPADAEIVIEGLIDPEKLEPEAPFGESNGYVALEAYNMPMQVTAITHRRNPVFTSIISQVTPSESSLVKKVAYEPLYLVAPARRAVDPRRAARGHARAADQPAAGDLRAVRRRHAAHRGLARHERRGEPQRHRRQDRHRGERGHRSRQPRRGDVVDRLSLQSDRGRAHPAVSRRRAGLAILRPRARLEAADRRHHERPDGAARAAEEGIHGAARRRCGRKLGLPPITLKQPWHGYELGDWIERLGHLGAQRAVRGDGRRTGSETLRASATGFEARRRRGRKVQDSQYS